MHHQDRVADPRIELRQIQTIENMRVVEQVPQIEVQQVHAVTGLAYKNQRRPAEHARQTVLARQAPERCSRTAASAGHRAARDKEASGLPQQPHTLRRSRKYQEPAATGCTRSITSSRPASNTPKTKLARCGSGVNFSACSHGPQLKRSGWVRPSGWKITYSVPGTMPRNHTHVIAPRCGISRRGRFHRAIHGNSR